MGSGSRTHHRLDCDNDHVWLAHDIFGYLGVVVASELGLERKMPPGTVDSRCVELSQSICLEEGGGALPGKWPRVWAP